MNNLELMRLHVEALFTHDRRARLIAVNEPNGANAPRFFLGRTAEGSLWRFSADLPDDLAADLERYCRLEPEKNKLSRSPEYQAEYLRLLAEHSPIERFWTGPAYWFAGEAAPTEKPVRIDEANTGLLRNGLDDWLEDVPYRQPFMAIIRDGRAVSVCASSRITGAAHEAGLETLPEYRRQGLAVSAAAGWAAEVRKLGAIPLYSTSWENTASQNVANKLGLTMFGVDFHIA